MISADAHQSKVSLEPLMSFDGNLKAFPSVRERYEAMVAAGDVETDPAQLELTSRYDRLIEEICSKRLSRKSSALGWLFGKRRETAATIKGLYVHGEVGRGKTMLMDMFFQLLPVERKRARISTISWPMCMSAFMRIVRRTSAVKPNRMIQSRRWRRR